MKTGYKEILFTILEDFFKSYLILNQLIEVGEDAVKLYRHWKNEIPISKKFTPFIRKLLDMYINS